MRKIFLFRISENHGSLAPSRLDEEGRLAIVTNVRRDAMDARVSGDD